MKPNFEVEHGNIIRNCKESIIVDNFPISNTVWMFSIINYETYKDKFSIGRWRVKEGSIKKK